VLESNLVAHRTTLTYHGDTYKILNLLLLAQKENTISLSLQGDQTQLGNSM
jgi:hypothetical protein